MLKKLVQIDITGLACENTTMTPRRDSCSWDNFSLAIGPFAPLNYPEEERPWVCYLLGVGERPLAGYEVVDFQCNLDILSL